jgi:Icc-related predicted phosphoesterase
MVSGISFFGVGGGVPVTPFGSWSYDFTEAQAAALLQDCPSQGVLISHSPPKGAVGRSSSGRSLGSTAVRETIVQKNPQLVVCGHIHESGGQQARINQTVVVNAGPKGILWQLPGSPA